MNSTPNMTKTWSCTESDGKSPTLLERNRPIGSSASLSGKRHPGAIPSRHVCESYLDPRRLEIGLECGQSWTLLSLWLEVGVWMLMHQFWLRYAARRPLWDPILSSGHRQHRSNFVLDSSWSISPANGREITGKNFTRSLTNPNTTILLSCVKSIFPAMLPFNAEMVLLL